MPTTAARCAQCGAPAVYDPAVRGRCGRCLSALEYRGEELEREARREKEYRACAERSRVPTG